MTVSSRRWPHLTLVVLALLVRDSSSLAGQRRKQRAQRRTTPAVEWNRATATVLEPTDERDLQILWGMAGQTSRRRLGRKPAQTTRFQHTPTAEEASGIGIAPAELESVAVDPSSLLASIALVNGTCIEANPRDFSQKADFCVWMATRRQLDLTASELSAILGNSYFTSREKLVRVKAGLEEPASMTVNSKACQWGIKMEPQAFKQYCQVTNNTVQETGLHITTHNGVLLGASPDGLVLEDNGLLEIKSLWGRRHKKELPKFDHVPKRFWDQIQGQLHVCDKEWCDLMLYIPPSRRHARNYCILRVPRDRDYWDKTLLPAIERFCQEVAELRGERS